MGDFEPITTRAPGSIPDPSAEQFSQAHHNTVEEILSESVKRRIAAAFAKLASIESSNPEVQALKDYGDNLELKFSSIKKNPTLNNQQILEKLREIPVEELPMRFARMIERIQLETHYFTELTDVGISKNIIPGLESGEFGAKVIFGVENRSKLVKMMSDLESTTEGGAYNPLFDVSFILDSVPTDIEIWDSIATAGMLPPVFSVLDHELTHDTQFGKLQRFGMWATFAAGSGVALSAHLAVGVIATPISLLTLSAASKIIQRFGNDEILSEIHAIDAAASSPSNADTTLDEKHEIVRCVAFNYCDGHADIPKALKAYDLVHTLRVLGLNDIEIGKLVSGERYDEEKETYPALQARLDKELLKLGPLSDGDKKLLIEALHARYELHLYELKAQARNIAINEILSI